MKESAGQAADVSGKCVHAVCVWTCVSALASPTHTHTHTYRGRVVLMYLFKFIAENIVFKLNIKTSLNMNEII